MNLEDFAQRARDYCSWMEPFLDGVDVSAADLRNLLPIAEQLLDGLVQLADMPNAAELESDGLVEGSPRAPTIRFTNDVLSTLYLAPDRDLTRWREHAKSRSIVAPSYQWVRYETLPEGGSIGDLSDDLACIYTDLARGLAYWERGFATDAQFEWKTLISHTGRHLVDAVCALRSQPLNCSPLRPLELSKRSGKDG